MRILIGGDVVPWENNRALFEAGDIAGLMGPELSALWAGADLRLFNLECPVTDWTGTLFKNGPCLRAGAKCLDGIAAMRPSLLLLANNHILDAGTRGLEDMLSTLEKKGIGYAGAGRSLEAMREYAILEQDGRKVAVYACCDREFSLAGQDSAGANGLRESSYDTVRSLKDRADALIVIYHGGKEYYRYPSPELKAICRGFARAGADLVLCQHSHCVGAGETFQGCKILYGQGNFIFTKKRDEFWKTSLMVQLDLTDEGLSIDYLPLSQTETGCRLADGSEKDEILAGLETRSREAQDDAFCEKAYAAFASELLPAYLYAFAGWGRLRRGLDRKIFHSALIRRRYSRKRMAAIWNFTATQAHRETLLKGLEDGMKAAGEGTPSGQR